MGGLELVETHISRISISVHSDLLQRFDDHIVRLGYANRSKAIQNVMQNLVTTIRSSMHIHLDQENCLEIIAVKGKASDVRDLAQELKTRKGVKQLKLAIVTP
jgi:CopG family nickel-responsive transcriptional regulator